jgi:glycerate kinase
MSAGAAALSPLVASERIGSLDAAAAAATIGRGLRAGGLQPPDLCPLERAGGAREEVAGMLAALGFDARLRRARAVILGADRLSPQTLAGSVLFEIATRARQGGVPAFAIARRSSLTAFEARILDLQVVLCAAGGSARALGVVARELAALV